MNYQQLNKDMKGMNTKKSILFWWEQLGYITEKNRDDLASFYQCIDPSITITEKKERERKEIYLKKPTWKYKLKLVFLGTECVNIAYF